MGRWHALVRGSSSPAAAREGEERRRVRVLRVRVQLSEAIVGPVTVERLFWSHAQLLLEYFLCSRTNGRARATRATKTTRDVEGSQA